MVVVDIDIPKKIYNNIQNKNNLKYEDIIKNYEESSFEYEKIWMKSWDFKNYLINELSNG